MEHQFTSFLESITLTSTQSSDAQTKYTGVCKKLYDTYYTGDYDDCKKFLFGSYKTKTNVRPLTPDQDVDVLFKIPRKVFDKYDAYAGNGQAALLQEVRDILKKKYTTTERIKAWGKVVLVQFSEGHHNVELLPALELEDNTFKIPNSEDGGSWEIFDPRKELEKFNNCNDSTGGLTRDLAKMLKAWAHNTTSMSYASYQRMDDIISFLSGYYPSGKQEIPYAKIVFDFYDFKSHRSNGNLKAHIDTALNRARKALEYADNGQQKEASEEWRKIFGKEFPIAAENPQKGNKTESISQNPIRPWSDSTKMK